MLESNRTIFLVLSLATRDPHETLTPIDQTKQMLPLSSRPRAASALAIALGLLVVMQQAAPGQSFLYRPGVAAPVSASSFPRHQQQFKTPGEFCG